MDELDEGTNVIESQIDGLMRETIPRVCAEKMMLMGGIHTNMLFEVELTIGKTVKRRMLSPGEAHAHDEQMRHGNNASKMEQTFKNHGVLTQVINFGTREDREEFMKNHQLGRDQSIGFVGCYEIPPQKAE